MKYTFFTLLFVFGLFFPAISQVIPITVTPVPINGVQRSPEELTNNGARLFAIFESYDKVLHYSDDNGATWIAKSFNIGGFLTDVVVAGTEIYVLAHNDYLPGEQSLVIYRSSNNGANFVSDYSVDVTPPLYANGKPEGYISDSRLITAGNAVFMVCDFRHQDMIGNWDKTLARGWYKELNTSYWDHLNSNIELNGPISHITYFNNKYVLVREPSVKGVTPSGLARASSTPDFLSGTDLPFDYTVGYPQKIHEMSVADGKLIVIADDGKIFTRTNTTSATKFTQQTLPYRIHSAGLLNGNLYYLTNIGIERAATADPLTTQNVFSGVFNTAAKGQDVFPFAIANNRLYCLGGLPLRSSDDGLTWADWPLTNILSWSGKIITAGNQMFSDLGWGVRSENGINFSLWHPDGLDNQQSYNWLSACEHKGRLFFVDKVVSSNGPYDQKIYRGDATGQQWEVINSQDSIYQSYFVTSKNRLYWFSRNWYNGVRKTIYSDDAGTSWQSTSGTMPEGLTEFVASGDSLFAVTQQGVLYSYNLGQTWSTTSVTTPSWRIFYYNGKLTLANYFSGIMMVSPDAGQNFYQVAALPGYNSSIYDFFPLNDSLLLLKNRLIATTYVCKIGSANMVSFDQQNAWKFIQSFASFGGFLYGSQASHEYYRENTSTLSRIPLDQILDPLNNAPENSGWFSGRLFFDPNQNCLPDAGEKRLAAQIVNITPGNHTVATNPDGSFGIALPPGNYQIEVDTPKYHTPSCFGPSTDFTVNTSQNVVKNVAFFPNTTAQDLTVILVSTRLRPGMPTTFTIDVKNNGTSASPAGVALRFTYQDGPLGYLSASPAPAFVNPGEVIFTLPSIPAYSTAQFRVQLNALADPALTGQTFFFTAEAVNTFSDAFAADNLTTLPVIVTNSLDPNDKTAFSIAPKGDQITLHDPLLKYLIRFQNTGTDTAFQVIVRDTLSSLLDIKTIKILSSSHPCRFVMRDNHIAEWQFNPIALPDSTTNEMASHGFVLFSIEAGENIPMGSRIFNNAGIYFDFNSPVITNTTKTKLVRRLIYRDEETAPTEVSVKIFPNPVVDRAVLEIKGSATGNYRFEISDATGKVVLQESFTGNRLEFSRKQLAAGAYTWSVVEGATLVGKGVVIYE